MISMEVAPPFAPLASCDQGGFDQFLQWFSLARYAPVRQFQLSDWCNALSIRETFHISDRFPIETYVQQLNSVLLRPAELGEWMPHEGHCAVVSELSLCTAWELREIISADNAAREACELWDKMMNTVPPKSSHELYSEEWMEESRNWGNVSYQGKNIHRSSFNDAFGEPEKFLIDVDLNAADALILEEFADLLRSKRAASKERFQSQTDVFTPKRLARWRQQQILPYLDLTAVATICDVKLPYHAIGNILFPQQDAVDLAEKVRNSTKPLAAEVMSHDTIRALEFAARQKTE